MLMKHAQRLLTLFARRGGRATRHVIVFARRLSKPARPSRASLHHTSSSLIESRCCHLLVINCLLALHACSSSPAASTSTTSYLNDQTLGDSDLRVNDARRRRPDPHVIDQRHKLDVQHVAFA